MTMVGISAIACSAFRPFATGPALGGVRLAVTVDDLPGTGALPAGMTRMDIALRIVQALKANGVPQVYGFATGLDIQTQPALIAVLTEWLKAGYPVGNHTFRHSDLNALTTEAYILEIETMDEWLEARLPPSLRRQERRVFRYPYLNEGETREKRQAIRSYLFSNGYKVAPVTVDFDDWVWNASYARCLAEHENESAARLRLDVVDDVARSVSTSRAEARRLVGRDIAHVLLVHINALNAVVLDAILTNLRKQGITFISLDEALRDPVYEIDPSPPYRAGLNFLEEIGAAHDVDIDRLRERLYTAPVQIERLCSPQAATK